MRKCSRRPGKARRERKIRNSHCSSGIRFVGPVCCESGFGLPSAEKVPTMKASVGSREQRKKSEEQAVSGKRSYVISGIQGLYMSKRSPVTAIIASVLFACLAASAATIATHSNSTTHKTRKSTKHVTESTAAQKKMSRMRHSSATAARLNRSSHVVVYRKRHHYYERFYASSFANDQVEGDITAGEDPVVRA